MANRIWSPGCCAGFVAGRLVAGVGPLIFLTLVFFLARLMIPGDTTTNFAVGGGGNVALVRALLGFNRPRWDQYLLWLGLVLIFNFGRTPLA